MLLANHTDFISPALMHWTRSGDLIVMAVLGGMGTVFGPVIGAVALLVLEEALPHLIGFVSHVFTGKEVAAAKEYWQLILGPMLLLIVLLRARRHRRPAREARAVADALLKIDGLTKRFGGVVASDNVVARRARRANCTPSSGRTAPARPR